LFPHKDTRLDRRMVVVINKVPRDRKKTNSKVGKCTKYFTKPVITENDKVLHIIKIIAFLYAFKCTILYKYEKS